LTDRFSLSKYHKNTVYHCTKGLYRNLFL